MDGLRRRLTFGKGGIRWPTLDFRSRERCHHTVRLRQSRQRGMKYPRATLTLLQCTLRWLFMSFIWIPQAQAALIEFQNCLDADVNGTNPHQLQFTPLFFDAHFDTINPSHNINISIYGNVSGTTINQPLPTYPAPEWNNASYTYGKVLDVSDGGGSEKSNFSTLQYNFKVLTYQPYKAPPSRFCNSTINGTACPIIPLFLDGGPNAPPPSYTQYPVFSIAHNLGSSFRFATIDSTISVNSGEFNDETQQPRALACASANITPDLGHTLRGLLRYLPVAVLILVALSTVSAAIFSPWGTTDPFKWTTNYGRDEDLLRLVTPGFGDCLQYIQFIVFSGALSLQYPGYFAPVVSQVSWSALMFNESFVSHGTGTQSLRDGIYITTGHYGLERMSQLVGMSQVDDIWAGMVVWLLIITGIVVVLFQVGFLFRWAVRIITNQPEENLQSKNWPMTGGNLVRIVCNFFLLPIVALSMFQLVIAAHSPAVVTAFAVILLVAILAFAGWILHIILTEKQRSRLFDDLPTVLLYGPLYNTYSDDAAPFALIPALLTFIRAVAVGAVQPSGIAQLVILAICEVVLILTLHAFRPFRKQTSMNAYHTFFAVARLVVTLLSVSFVDTLGVTEPTKGWLGYVVLLIHAIVLVFGFLLNSIQTLIEVSARAAGAGGDDNTGAATRGALVKVFGSRQLSRRARRPGFRHSLTSDAAILTEDQDAFDGKSGQFGGRSRSVSASSAILLNQRTPDRMSTHLDRTESGSGDGNNSSDHAPFSFLPDNGGIVGATTRPDLRVKTTEPTDPYYRPPRPRRPTGDLMTPGARSRGSWAGGDLVKKSHEDNVDQPEQRNSTGRPISVSPENKITPSPAYMRQREGSDPVLNNERDPNRPDVDYAVREVDFYYGVRGPALSNQPTRKLKTGPADPVGPVSSATGWFKGMFGRKTKDSGKGFEVVRSSRAPPQRFTDESPQGSDPEPYQDSPQSQTGGAPSTVLPGQRTRSTEEDREHQADGGAREASTEGTAPSVYNSDDEPFGRPSHSLVDMPRVTDAAPSLDPIDAGGELQLPSRIGSKSTVGRNAPGPVSDAPLPMVPPKSTKRESWVEDFEPRRLSTVPDAPERSSNMTSLRGSSAQGDLPISTPFSSDRNGHHSLGADSTVSFDPPQPSYAGGHHRYNTSDSMSLTPPRDQDTERPTSMGFVNQFRASDSITEGPNIHSRAPSAAEFVTDSGRRSRASGGSQATQEFGW